MKHASWSLSKDLRHSVEDTELRQDKEAVNTHISNMHFILQACLAIVYLKKGYWRKIKIPFLHKALLWIISHQYSRREGADGLRMPLDEHL